MKIRKEGTPYTRIFNGKEYVLAGYPNLFDTKVAAERRAEKARDTGYARVVKVNGFTEAVYAVYERVGVI